MLRTVGPPLRSVQFETQQPRKRLSVLPGLPQRLLVVKKEQEPEPEPQEEEEEDEEEEEEMETHEASRLPYILELQADDDRSPRTKRCRTRKSHSAVSVKILLTMYAI